MTAIDLANQVLKIQNILESIEVHGYRNASAIATAYETCNLILQDLKETLIKIQNESEGVGELNGKIDRL